jgi:hypothetical protein
VNIDEARTFLRDELTALGSQALPSGQGPMITEDVGPVAPDDAFDGLSDEYVSYVSVEIGDPGDTRTPYGHVVAASQALVQRGWQVTPVVDDGTSTEAVGARNGFTVVVRMRHGQRVLRLSGMTPVYGQPA